MEYGKETTKGFEQKREERRLGSVHAVARDERIEWRNSDRVTSADFENAKVKAREQCQREWRGGLVDHQAWKSEEEFTTWRVKHLLR